MKKFTILLIMLFAFGSIINAADITSAGSGDWSATGTWVGGTVPGSGDKAIIIAGHTITLDVDATIQDLDIAATAELNGGSSYSITFNSKNGTVLIDGYMEVLNLDCPNNSAMASFDLNGDLHVNGTFSFDKTDINGDGTVYAATYNGTAQHGSVFGNTNPENGHTYGGSTWSGATDSDWNTAANWYSGSVPNANSTVYVTTDGAPNFPVISTGAAGLANALVIQAGASLTVEDANSLTLSNNTTTGFHIESTSAGSGSFIADGAFNATVQRHVPAGAWHQVASATDGANTSNFYDAANDSWLTKHTESTDAWTYILNVDSALSRNQGFDYWVTTARTVQFTGALTGADQSVSLDYSGSGIHQGWNFLGNPFPSALDWDLGSWGGNVEATVYVWDNTIGNSGDYAYWITGTPGSGTLSDGIVPMGQGFFVKSTSAGVDVTIPAAARVHDDQGFYKSSDDSDPTQYVRIQMDGNGHVNTVFVGFPEIGTDEFDYYGDAFKLYSSKETPQIFAVENEKELCINANAPLSEGESKTVHLNMIQVIDGEYALSISDLDQLPDATITIEDLQTGATQDLRENNVYSFTGSKEDNPERFLLHFAWSPDGIGEGIAQASNINIYSSGKDIYVNSTDGAINQEGTIYVYDLMGREIVQQSIRSGELVKLTVNIRNAYAVVKVVKEGFVKTEKVFIK